MKALITQSNKTVAVEEVPVPTIADNEILAKTVAVAQNPTDWKYVESITNTGTISGCDWSGNVVQVGKNVKDISVGDHVAAFVHGGNYKDRGAFAEFVKAEADLVWKVPKGTLSHEEAATLGCAFWTAAQALFHPKRLGLTESPSKALKNEWVFVYAGSTSVGMYALQLAHAAGYRVITVASPKNHDLCKSLGADVVFDYKDPSAVDKIKEATGNSIHAALDTISLEQSQNFTIKSFGPGPGKIIVLLPPQEAAQKLRQDVKIQHTLLYTALGKGFDYGPTRFDASSEDREQMVDFLQTVPGLVSSGAVKPNPIKLWDGGLSAIKDGLQWMKEGNNSGEKIVYKV